MYELQVVEQNCMVPKHTQAILIKLRTILMKWIEKFQVRNTFYRQYAAIAALSKNALDKDILPYNSTLSVKPDKILLKFVISY